MARFHKTSWGWAFLICCGGLLARAQDTEFLPELDTNLTLNSLVRVNVQAKGEREAGDPLQFQIGPSVLFYLKPLVKLKDVTVFDLDDSKSRFLVIETGYRYIVTPNAPSEERMIVAATSNFPLKAGFLFSDRNRADLDWKEDKFSWRYRSRFQLQRALPIRSYHLIPYAAAEIYFLSQYSKLSTTALFAGCLFPVGKHVQFDSYYEHENNTGGKRNTQNNDIGLALHLYYSVEK